MFISYAHVDDKGAEWVAKFEDDLAVRIAQVSGRSIEVWRDKNKLGAGDRFNQEIEAQIHATAVLVPVLSPSYFESKYCTKERTVFASIAPDIHTKARIVKIAKTPVPLERYPEDLRTLLEHAFFHENRELHLHQNPLVRSWYHTRIDDVAQEIATILQLMEPAAAPATPAGTVFLAETSPDLEEPRNALRRHLLQRGYEVLPKSPLRFATPLEESIAAQLATATLTIHPIGKYYESLVKLQLEQAAQDRRNGTLSRFVWMPEKLQPADQPQSAFLQEIRERWAGNPFQIFEAPLDQFQTELARRLERSRPATSVRTKPRPSVYVLCSGEQDRKATRPLRQYLTTQGLDVGSAAPAASIHSKRLAEDDAFLIYYGDCGDDWVRSTVAQVCAPEGRTTPVLSRAVLLADPVTDDKEDLILNEDDARVLPAYTPAPLESAIEPFLKDIRQGSARAASGGRP